MNHDIWMAYYTCLTRTLVKGDYSYGAAWKFNGEKEASESLSPLYFMIDRLVLEHLNGATC